jgi:hypothetical protein
MAAEVVMRATRYAMCSKSRSRSARADFRGPLFALHFTEYHNESSRSLRNNMEHMIYC